MNLKNAIKKINAEIDTKSYVRHLLGNPEYIDGSKEFYYRCPFHKDNDPSFSFNVDKGVFYCQGCGAKGNKIQLYEELYHVDREEAVKQLAQEYGISLNGAKPPALKISTYANQKGLDPKKLKEYGLENGKRGIKMPYFDTEGNTVATRTRKTMHKGIDNDKRFMWNKGDSTTLYGLWRLEDYQPNRILLVEGESCCHTLWQHDFQALGIPGVGNWKDEWTDYLAEFRPKEIILIQESAARKEVLQIAHTLWESLDSEIYALHLPTDDVSDFYLQDEKYFENRFNRQIEGLNDQDNLDFNEQNLAIEYRCRTQDSLYHDGQRLGVSYPYLIDNKLYKYKINQERASYKERIANYPIYLGGRYRNEVDKSIWTEVVWEDEDGKDSKLLPRGEAFDSHQNGIRQLADYGAPVHSRNSGKIVDWFESFEDWNKKELKPRRGSSQMGWIRQKDPVFLLGDEAIGGPCKFIPEGIQEQQLAKNYEKKGKREEWVKLWNKLSNPHSRFVVSGIIASPLIRLLNQRSGLLYLYGESGIGKTATLYLGLSAYGNPDKLKSTAYSTTVGMERRAALFNDLPLAIDERQTSITERFIGQLVYMLSGGQSKSRGKKEGGLQTIKTWRSLAVMTGEQDLTGNKWTGIENRTLQLHLTELLEEDFSIQIYNTLTDNYGHIGREFISKLVEMKPIKVNSLYDKISKEIEEFDISGAKKSILATIGTSEKIIWEILDHEDAYQKAVDDLRHIGKLLNLDIRRTVAEQAKDFLLEKYGEFRAELDSRASTEGKKDKRAFREDDKLYIMSNKFNEWIKESGFTSQRIKKDFAEKDWIVTEEVSGKRHYTIRKMLSGIQNRYVVIKLDSEDIDADLPPF